MNRLVATGLLLVAHGAYGGPSNVDAADAAFRRAKALIADGKVAEACAQFDESERLDPQISTLLNQADCRERNGQLATAWRLFREAARKTAGKGSDTERQLHGVAADRAAKLEPRLSTLRIDVPAERRVPGLEVRRDRELVDPSVWNGTQPIDAGTYVIAASAPGYRTWSTEVAVALARDARRVEIPELERDVVERHRSHREPAAVTPPVGRASPWTTPRLFALGTGVASIGLFTTGLLLGRSATSHTDAASRLCPDPDVACANAGDANAELATARDRAHGANITLAAGGACAVTATILWIVGAPSSTTIAVAPAGDGGTVSYVGRF